MSHTPLYYSSVSGISGLSFSIGNVVLFAPTEDTALHIIRDTAALHVTAQVPDLLERFLQETVVEPRLAAVVDRWDKGVTP
jgi:hypothetical protein